MLRGKNWSFIHIPKCSGSALRQHLDGYEFGEFMPLGSSCAVKSVLHRIPRKRPSGRVFTVIRHPAMWLRSYWFDQSPQRINGKRYLHQFWSDDLDEFVANVCTGDPGYVGKLYRAHIRYHNVHIFRLENGLGRVLKWLGSELKNVPVFNVSPLQPKLSDKSLALVAQAERPVLQRFGYTL